MITTDTRKEIFILRFIKLNSIRQISRDLNISRVALSNIIKDCMQKIESLDLQYKTDLLPFINVIVVPPIRKQRIVHRYKVTENHITIIKELIIKNEWRRTRTNNAKSVLTLYRDFLAKLTSYGEEVISYSTFSNIATKEKKLIK
ncbi:MAG: hypothetical protein ACREVX_01385 [Clostridium sp.]|uniref:hypothetical protein n=1 Tax=Clostridium sp. TaxID=1506 RepID=UPI003D6D184F